MRESDFVFLERADYPEWFYLDFLPAVGTIVPPRLLIGIAEDALHRVLAFLTADVLKHDLGEDFLRNIERPWGFGGCLEPYSPCHWVGASTDMRAVNGFNEFVIAIPQIEKDAGKCTACRGKKKNQYDDECIHCGGTGRETATDWERIDQIAKTLSVLSEAILDKPDKKLLVDLSDTKRKQLLSVCLNIWEDRVYIGATLARSFGDYLREHSRQELPEIQVAIKSAYLRMFPSNKRFGDSGLYDRVDNNGQLLIDAQGGSLFVDGCDDCLRERSGPMNLIDHNVDGAHQQITLLCGLAALSGMVRKGL